MTLYAALNAQNHICFVGDVPRGASCGCHCPTCNSPLVSKQGAVNVWHFAHESNQERPECTVGRHNLLRRLAMELISQAGGLKLPSCVFNVNGGALAPNVIEQAVWDNPTVTLEAFDASAPAGQRVAQLLVRAGGTEYPVDLFVELNESTHTMRESTDGRGEVTYHCRPPAEGELTSLQSAKDYLAIHGHVEWYTVPDMHGKISYAKERLKTKIRQIQETRWAIQAKAEEARRQRAAEELSFQPGRTLIEPAAPPIKLPDWMDWKKPNTSFFAFKTGDNEFWVLLQATHAENVYIVPAPNHWEGWDETFPPSLAEPYPTHQCYISTLPITTVAQWFYKGRNKGSRIESDPFAIAKFTGMA